MKFRFRAKFLDTKLLVLKASEGFPNKHDALINAKTNDNW